jgi:DNA-binding SARP family transcriptional activator/Tfp pilus assembly protein PilF
MKAAFTDTQDQIGLALERSGNKMTIRNANLALEQARLEGNSENIATALIQVAHLHFRQGRYSQTRTLAAEVLQDAPPNSLRRCDALRMVGNCAAELGDPDSAETYYHQAIDLARQLDYRYTIYKCLHSLATNIYWPRGQFDLTLAAGNEALQQAQSLNLTEELWFPLSDIAWAYWSTGQRRLAGEAADLMQKVVVPGSLGEGFYCCLRAGLLEPAPGYLEAALALYDRARSIAEATGDPGLNVEVRLGLSRSHRNTGNIPASAAWAEDAVQNVIRMNYRQFLAVTLIERGRTAIAAGDRIRAQSDLLDAAEIATQLRANFDLARANLYLAAVFSGQKFPDARGYWRQTANLVQMNGYDFLLEEERSLVLPLIASGLDSPDLDLSKTSKELFDRMQNTSPAPLRVRMLGQFSVRVGSRPISKDGFRQRRAGELLALLLASPGQTQTYQQITEAMCPEKDPDAALDFYHHASSALRRLLEPDLPDRRFPCRYLEVDEERVSLRLPVGSTIDFRAFEAALKGKDWQLAVELYEGEFLPALRYAEWTILIRQHLADQHEAAMLTLAESKLKDGDPTTCLELSRQVLLKNSWQEQAVELGMRAALELGDRITALKLYQRLEKVLAKELGIAPQKELQQLYITVKKDRSR